MDASVVICTRNRANSLARTLASLVTAERPAGFSWELVVVDNGSTDDTASVLADFATRLPLVPTAEPKPGLSNARNHGVATARGRYLIWTDDDVVVEPSWLAAYADAFRRWPEAALFGGKILPVLEEPVRPWFASCQNELAHLLAGRNFGEVSLPLDLDGDRLPFGANYVVRAAEQRRFAYDPNLGVRPGRSGTGEETQVIRAILAESGTGHYVPDAIVHHLIAPGRQTTSYVRSYYRAHGRTNAMMERHVRARCFGGLPLWLWRQIASEGAAYGVARLFSAPHVWVRHLKKYSYWKGYADFLKEGGTEYRQL